MVSSLAQAGLWSAVFLAASYTLTRAGIRMAKRSWGQR